jgi:hypothetical protein
MIFAGFFFKVLPLTSLRILISQPSIDNLFKPNKKVCRLLSTETLQFNKQALTGLLSYPKLDQQRDTEKFYANVIV